MSTHGNGWRRLGFSGPAGEMEAAGTAPTTCWAIQGLSFSFVLLQQKKKIGIHHVPAGLIWAVDVTTWSSNSPSQLSAVTDTHFSPAYLSLCTAVTPATDSQLRAARQAQCDASPPFTVHTAAQRAGGAGRLRLLFSTEVKSQCK